MNNDKIQRSVEIAAPVSRVWQALTDYRQFSTWFKVALDGPFQVGQPVTGKMTYPGYEGAPFEAMVTRMEPERLFAYTWPAYSEDPAVDVSQEPPTTVVFELEPTKGGTRLTVTETGFANRPPHRAAEAFRANSEGWTIQMKNIHDYVASQATARA